MKPECFCKILHQANVGRRLNFYRIYILQAVVCSLDGKKNIQAKSQLGASLENATTLGRAVTDDLLSRGAASLMANERTARSLETGG